MTEDSLSVTWQASNNNKGPYKFLFSVAFLSVIKEQHHLGRLF